MEMRTSRQTYTTVTALTRQSLSLRITSQAGPDIPVLQGVTDNNILNLDSPQLEEYFVSSNESICLESLEFDTMSHATDILSPHVALYVSYETLGRAI
ncbi:hypothetical protein RRG08_030783 [Elysia crispata]|uniref:Uncharacterized protein n=1 Tax=Elysia crispata TaxID=231223 RepID=A0AAE1CXT3_9GAST|nr:hypothetical protein RRG08_030783 [Elysia crispata]